MAIRPVTTKDIIVERLAQLAAELVELGATPDVVGRSMIGAGAALVVSADGHGVGATDALLRMAAHIARKDRPAVAGLQFQTARGTA